MLPVIITHSKTEHRSLAVSYTTVTHTTNLHLTVATLELSTLATCSLASMIDRSVIAASECSCTNIISVCKLACSNCEKVPDDLPPCAVCAVRAGPSIASTPLTQASMSLNSGTLHCRADSSVTALPTLTGLCLIPIHAAGSTSSAAV
jgi:hypothetical protein